MHTITFSESDMVVFLETEGFKCKLESGGILNDFDMIWNVYRGDNQFGLTLENAFDMVFKYKYLGMPLIVKQ